MSFDPSGRFGYFGSGNLTGESGRGVQRAAELVGAVQRREPISHPPGTHDQAGRATAKHLAPGNVRRILGQAQCGIGCEYSAHARFYGDLRQGMAHAVVRASAEVEQSGCVGPRKGGGVEMIRFPPDRRIAARGDNAEKDHRAGRNRGVVQVNQRTAA